MPVGKEKIKSFKDLHAWQEAHKLTIVIYKLTKNFPREETFGLTSQIRRSSLSIGANIAEGFSRISQREKVQFYSISLGSVTETENHSLVARDLGYIHQADFFDLEKQTMKVNKLFNGLIKSARMMDNHIYST